MFGIFGKFWYFFCGVLRSISKWFLHTFTRLSELQRICYGKQSGAQRTKEIENSLYSSRSPKIKQLILSLDNKCKQKNISDKEFTEHVISEAVQIIIRIKKIDIRIHSGFQKMLGDCVESIWDYQRLYYQIESLRITQYDCTNLMHEQKLYELWNLLSPNEPLEARITKQWQDIGFQGDDPKTDFRGMGILGLENLLYLAKEYNGAALHVLQHSHHPKYGYTFAVVGINLTSMAYQLFKNGAAKTHFYNKYYQRNPITIDAFNKFYSYLFYEFDRYWMQSKPTSLMDFSIIMSRFEADILKQLNDMKTCFRINFSVENV